MSSYPEQERALTYLRRRGTEAPLAAIRERVAETYREIEAAASGIDEARAAARPPSGGWCVMEVVDHLTLTDRAAAEQLRVLLAGQSSPEAVPAGLLSPDPFAMPWPTLLGEFRRVHRELLAILDGASEHASLVPKAKIEMVVKHQRPDGTLEPIHWFEHFDWKAFAITFHAHNREHLAQIGRILAATA